MTNAPLPRLFVAMLVALPLVQVGTIRGPVRLILSDLLALVLAGTLAWQGRARAGAWARDPYVFACVGAALLLAASTTAATAISLAWITPHNFQQWGGYLNALRWLGSPLERGLLENLRLVQCACALVVTLAVVDTLRRLHDATRWYVFGATLAAVYGLYVWAVMVTGRPLPLLPGTFSYLHLQRTAATFPEPAAYGGFALTGIVLTLWLLEREGMRRPLVVAMALQLVAAVTSLSTLVVGGLGVLWLTSLIGVRARTLAAFTIAAVISVTLVFVALPTEVVLRAVQKPLTMQASWLDRVTSWRAASAMASAYPVLGVGAGLYAYNQAPFLPGGRAAQYAGGRVNSPALEVAAESGLVGVVAGAVLFAAAWRGAARGGHGIAGLRAAGVLAVLLAGHYTSRHAFLWVFTALLIAGGTVREAAGARTQRRVVHPAASGRTPAVACEC